jgi:hypothetical protein
MRFKKALGLASILGVLVLALGLMGVRPYSTSAEWECFVGTCVIGHANADAIAITTDGGTVTVDGYVSGRENVSVIASGALTVNAVNVVTTAADADIPDGYCDDAADVGNWVTVVVRDDSEAVSVTSDDASNVFIVPGLSLGAGDEVDSAGGATSNGEHLTLVCSVAETWVATSMEGVWADGGVAD